MFQTIFDSTSVTNGYAMDIDRIIISMLTALGLGLLISITYLLTCKKKERSQSFLLSLVILPAIVAVVILLIGGNLARAFSMAGIFTLVRFRSVPGDSKNISLIFLAMAVGLAAGLGYLTLGAAVAIIISVVIIVFHLTGFGGTKQQEMRLRIIIPEDMNYQNAFDDLFEKYTSFHEMQKVKTTNLGTLFELHYDVIMKKDISEKEFIDALRCRNGNLSIQLGIKENIPQQL